MGGIGFELEGGGSKNCRMGGVSNDFSVTIPRCYKDVNSFFLRTARLLNSLPNAFHQPMI